GQGDVESDGREMASVCRKIHKRKLSGTPGDGGEATQGCRLRLGPSLRLTAAVAQRIGIAGGTANEKLAQRGANGAAALGAAFLLGEGEGPDAEQSNRRA